MLKEINERRQKEFTGMYLTNAGLSLEQIRKLKNVGYYEAPASRKHHLAEPGGLAIHSTNVTFVLKQMTEVLGIEWKRPEAPYLVGMLHDLVKTSCYVSVEGEATDEHGREIERWFEYIQPAYPGHGIASVMIATELGIELMPDEIAAITYHMGMFGVGREYTDKEFNAALAKFPQQLIATHCADWYAARVTEEGVFEV